MADRPLFNVNAPPFVPRQIKREDQEIEDLIEENESMKPQPPPSPPPQPQPPQPALTSAETLDLLDPADGDVTISITVRITQDVITMDETWIPYANPDPQNQWLKENQRPAAAIVHDFRQKKILLSVFWGPEGVIHCRLHQRAAGVQRYKSRIVFDQCAWLSSKLFEFPNVIGP
ncbi:Transposase [Aphelenchoides besseyi]|nr:Transposase [Aphelenchoides besseyi]